MERIVPRRQLLIEDGDFLILRTPAGLSSLTVAATYEVLAHGVHRGGERLTTFELAVARGSELAALWRVRLFYAEDPGASPHLLQDCRLSIKRDG